MVGNGSRILISLLVGGLLAGCESLGGGEDEESQAPVAVEDRGISAEEMAEMDAQAEARTQGIEEAETFQGSALDDPSSPLSTRIIYFEYDSFQVAPEYRSVLQAHAGYLAENPNLVVTLEGHADERGSREYNLALGEKRALEVRRQAVLLGANATQVRTFSYGEEKPLVEGQDDRAYAENRRVEIVY